MQEFLNDYGMVWVGSGHPDPLDEVLATSFWHPAVNTLNALAGEGSLRVEANQQCATLKVFKFSKVLG